MKLIFSSITNRGIDYDREPREGEYSRNVSLPDCAWFRSTPERYEWTGTELIEFPGWQAEQDFKALCLAQDKMRNLILARETEETWKPIEHPILSGIYHKATDAIARTTKRFRDVPDGAPFPINGGAWRDINGVPVQMTMGELRALEDALFDRAAHNDGVSQYHVSEMLELSDPTLYNYSQGWL